jgi:hypothetical protein
MTVRVMTVFGFSCHSPKWGKFVRPFALADERTFPHSERIAIRASGREGCKKSLLQINESCPIS